MDTLLIAVTGIALTLAVVMGVLLARMLREERRRSDARVQLLDELAAAEAKPAARTPAAPSLPSFLLPTAADLPLRRTRVEVSGAHELFHEEHEPSPWPRRFAVIGSLAAVLMLTVLGWTQMRGTSTVATHDAAASTQTAEAAALELLSLRHAREGNTLIVTGLLQNPKGGAALANVQATLFVFGEGGTFLTSGRAPLDFTSLTPGEESPFVIRVPVRGDVARYRVGFRGPDDRVVGHVDRRVDQVGRSF